jgi:hypothetical protein
MSRLRMGTSHEESSGIPAGGAMEPIRCDSSTRPWCDRVTSPQVATR